MIESRSVEWTEEETLAIIRARPDKVVVGARGTIWPGLKEALRITSGQPKVAIELAPLHLSKAMTIWMNRRQIEEAMRFRAASVRAIRASTGRPIDAAKRFRRNERAPSGALSIFRIIDGGIIPATEANALR